MNQTAEIATILLMDYVILHATSTQIKFLLNFGTTERLVLTENKLVNISHTENDKRYSADIFRLLRCVMRCENTRERFSNDAN